MSRYPTPPPVEPRQTLADLVADAIDTEAAAFPHPAHFRAAASRVVECLQSHAVEDIARELAFADLARFLRQLAAMPDTAQTLDALTVICRGDSGNIAALARKHGVGLDRFHRRVARLSRYLGIPYRRRRAAKGRTPRQ